MVMESRTNVDAKPVEHRHVPMLDGKYHHRYPRGGARTQVSFRLPNPLLENIDYLCEVYGLQRWSVISLAISSFMLEQDL